MISEIILLLVGIAVLVGQYVVGLQKDRESKRTEKELRTSMASRDQQIDQDRGEITGLKDSVLEKEHQIAELQQKLDVIQSLTLHVVIDLSTPSQNASDEATDLGLVNCLALFEKNGTRYRFCSDGKFQVHQYRPDRMQIRFVYESEDFAQFGGNPIGLLSKMESLGVNFSEFLKVIKFIPGIGDDSLSLTVWLNGVDVAKVEGKVGGPGTFLAGQKSLSVENQFRRIPEAYTQKIKEKATQAVPH